MQSLAQGQVLNNRYRIAKLIGHGGFGAVYRAWDLTLKQPVALKENLDISPEAQRQFEREATLMASLRHPNLPRVMDHFFLPGQGQYLAMDFVEGQSLAALLAVQGRPFTEAEALPWLEQVCMALDYLHTRQPPIVHRDIKPENIIITPEGQAMLVDFGISKVYDAQLATTVGARAVTPGYSPPEQYGTGKADARTDIYALGATLYRMLTGVEPPPSVDLVAGATSLQPPRQINKQLDRTTEQAVLQAMAVNMSQRFDCASDFFTSLTLQSTQAATHPTNLPPDIQQPTEPLLAKRVNVYTSSQPTSQNLAGIEWVKIPAGGFLYGQKNEKQYIRKPFMISKYPITHAQYKLFLDANPKHNVPVHDWKPSLFDWNVSTRTHPPGKDSHPVVCINYEDAQAFCRWAHCRLPTEQEWEKAARSTDGRTYPWGEEWLPSKYCNIREANIGDTTPVDDFPAGVSPYGVWDMIGNVIEWTSSNYDAKHKVGCGGSWSNIDDNICAASRYLLTPTTRYYNIGFRCVKE